MSAVNYTKMSGAGNTFILLAHDELPEGFDLARSVPAICDSSQEHGGADGLIAIARGDGCDFRMLYYNRDGSTGMMCGNGGRCAVRYAVDHGFVVDTGSITFVNAGVTYRAELVGEDVRLHFPDPRSFKLKFRIEFLGDMRSCHFADVGTPHAVIFIDELGDPRLRHLSQIDIDVWGPAIRSHRDFAPEGANANFVEILPDRSGILLRTFERGVEAETGACGTGAVASAILAATLRGVSTPVSVTTSSGATLTVDFRNEHGRITAPTLEGNAEVLLEGALELESIAG